MKIEYRITLLALVILIISCTDTKMKEKLFQPSAFTPLNSFTSGAEGPAVDVYKRQLYCHLYQKLFRYNI